MSLKATLAEDLKTAMKAGDELRREAVRGIRAAMIEAERKGTLHELTPEEELSILQTAVKRRKESIEQFVAAGRQELAAREEAEMKIIAAYLPAQLGEAEVREIIQRAVAATGATGEKDFGRVMGVAMKDLKGKADGALVQRVVKELLAS
jgi:uncharacterized protein YqeY